MRCTARSTNRETSETDVGCETSALCREEWKGADVPTGQAELRSRVADLNFDSIEYQWLVVAGTKAKFKGVGTIDGEGEYGFMLTATDGENKDDPDTFRIKIWDKSAGDGVVYDNKMGEPDESDAGTEIGGGNIVVHKAK